MFWKSLNNNVFAFCIAFLTTTALQVKAQSEYEHCEQRKQNNLYIAHSTTDHDIPSYHFLDTSDHTVVKAPLRLIAPKIAFKLTGGNKRYEKLKPEIEKNFSLPNILEDEFDTLLSKHKHLARLYQGYTSSNEFYSIDDINLPSRSRRHDERIWVNYLLGNFLTGTGPEIISFGTNSTASTALKKSRLVRKIMTQHLKETADTSINNCHYRANFKVREVVKIISQPVGIEHFTGSFDCIVSNSNDSIWEMTIINITSTTSADLLSVLVSNDKLLKSFPRKTSPHPYGNVMQIVQIVFVKEDFFKLKIKQ